MLQGIALVRTIRPARFNAFHDNKEAKLNGLQASSWMLKI
jgi:hypothetical protein